MSVNSGQSSGKEHEDRCVTCGQEVKEDDEALQCDLCEVWEHLTCIKLCDRPTNDCYAALSQSLCKSLVFTCTKCRRKLGYPSAASIAC